MNEREGLRGGQHAPRAEPTVERLSGEKLHHHEVGVVRLLDAAIIEERHHVGVLQLRKNARLKEEPLLKLRVFFATDIADVAHLDGHRATQRNLLAAINLAHAAVGEHRMDLIPIVEHGTNERVMLLRRLLGRRNALRHGHAPISLWPPRSRTTVPNLHPRHRV
jgi:hypothetical protein